MRIESGTLTTIGRIRAFTIIRAAFGALGFVLFLFTAPVLVGDDVPESLKWWRKTLEDLGGNSLQVVVWLLGFGLIVGALFIPRLVERHPSRTPPTTQPSVWSGRRS